MARPRKKNLELPKSYQLRHGSYYFIDKGKWIQVSKTLAGCLEHASKRAEVHGGGIADLIDKVLPMINAGLLRPRKKGVPMSKGTIEVYQSAAKILKAMIGHTEPKDLEAADAWEVIDQLTDRPATANHCLSIGKQVFAYALRRRMVTVNPFLGIPPVFQPKRDRLVTPEEYAAIYEKAEPMLQWIMDLMFCTGQRVDDVVSIKYTDLTGEGIKFTQGKTEAKVTPVWTPDLRAVVARIQATPRHIQATTLLHTKRGKKLNYQVLNRMWLKASRAADVPYTQLRDIRAMSATAIEEVGGIEQAQALLGHTTPQTTQIYLRGRKSTTVSGPAFKGKK